MLHEAEIKHLIQQHPELSRLALRYSEPLSSGSRDKLPCATSRDHLMVELSYALLDIDGASAQAFEHYSIRVLVDFLKRSHRYYLNVALPAMGIGMHQLGRLFPHEERIHRLLFPVFKSFCDDLQAHILWEEQGFFPYVLALDSHDCERIAYHSSSFLENHPEHKEELGLICSCLSSLEQDNPGEMAIRMLHTKALQLRDDMKLHGLVEDEALASKVQRLELQLGR